MARNKNCENGVQVQVVVMVFVMVCGFQIEVGLAMGSMASLAASYGENGPALCGVSADGSELVTCFGSDAASVYGAPLRIGFRGLTAGDGFVCGLETSSGQPYCWGNNIYVQMGVPPAMASSNTSYVEISAGDNHLCALRRRRWGVDCWGYNMTGSYLEGARLESITAGALFNCGLFAENRTAVCWGDETGSGVIGGIPRGVRFRVIAAGGYHVCGIDAEEPGRTVCWGVDKSIRAPNVALGALVGGKFHTCGIAVRDRRVWCWGLVLPGFKPAPKNFEFFAVAAGDYFTCGVSVRGLQTVCWGSNYPTNLPLAVAPGICKTRQCEDGTYEYSSSSPAYKSICQRSLKVCVPCSHDCPAGMYQSLACSPAGDRQCSYNCSACAGSGPCSEACRVDTSALPAKKRSSIRTPIIIAEMAMGIIVVSILVCVAVIWVRFKLKADPSESMTATCKSKSTSVATTTSKCARSSSEIKIRRAQVFSYEELERATGGFQKDTEVGRGSYSCVFKGVLSDGRVVAVKRAIVATDVQKDSKEFHREVDLLSRLNHAHLLNLLGYCEENEERLLVYEFMADGTLHEHLHGKSKKKLDWVRRVTIAVQAARGLEYLHGYACPPVIHRDIKSSNILIDQERNARVADFGLSLLGPADSDSPLSELPAGTLGYLDPEYYRLHYLTTKSDVYSFGVLLLEILSGRKAIDLQYEEGNVVEWAVPLIKANDISAILDPTLEPPLNYEALYKIARVACRCVRMRGKERPSMDKVTTELERALALLMGTPCDDQPILPTEVVLGSSRLHRRSSGSNESELRAPSWITFPSVASSQRRKSSVSEENKNDHMCLRCLEGGERKPENEKAPEIGPASPQQELYLQSNF